MFSDLAGRKTYKFEYLRIDSGLRSPLSLGSLSWLLRCNYAHFKRWYIFSDTLTTKIWPVSPQSLASFSYFASFKIIRDLRLGLMWEEWRIRLVTNQGCYYYFSTEIERFTKNNQQLYELLNANSLDWSEILPFRKRNFWQIWDKVRDTVKWYQTKVRKNIKFLQSEYIKIKLKRRLNI